MQKCNVWCDSKRQMVIEGLILNQWSVKAESSYLCPGTWRAVCFGSIPGIWHTRSLMGQVIQNQHQSHIQTQKEQARVLGAQSWTGCQASVLLGTPTKSTLHQNQSIFGHFLVQLGIQPWQILNSVGTKPILIPLMLQSKYPQSQVVEESYGEGAEVRWLGLKTGVKSSQTCYGITAHKIVKCSISVFLNQW